MKDAQDQIFNGDGWGACSVKAPDGKNAVLFVHPYESMVSLLKPQDVVRSANPAIRFAVIHGFSGN